MTTGLHPLSPKLSAKQNSSQSRLLYAAESKAQGSRENTFIYKE
jgi:hypothetical protein